MSKDSNAPNPTKHFVPGVARAIVRIWPAESREWGQAFAAELPAAESTGAATTWLIGGLMLLLREWLKHAWRALGRPLGASSASDTTAAFTPRYSRTPRTPLWLMLALTLSSLALLLHPEVRQALTFLRSAYTSHGWTPEEWSSYKKLTEISKTNRDPHLLALLSLLSSNPDERSQLSQEAILKDPTLTWLDYEQSFTPVYDRRKQIHISRDRIERLNEWDPQNSIPHILAAEIMAESPQHEEWEAVMRGKPASDIEIRIAANPAWIAEMHAAFSAPKYDNYMPQATELIRIVSSQFSVRDPRIAEYILSSKRVPQFLLLDDYAQFLEDRGSACEKAGNTQQALASYSEILRFAQRIKLNAETPDEQYFAERMGQTAGEKLAPLYASLGRADEASMISFQVAQWKAEHDPRIFRYMPLRYHRAEFKSLVWSGLLINLAGLSLLLILPLALISILFVASRRKTPAAQRGFTDFCASLFADAAPWLLLASSLLIFFTYHPYAQICRAFLDGGPAAPTLQSFMSAMMVPFAIPDNFEFLHDPVSHWSALTTFLCLLLILFLSRMLLHRSKPTA
jgi:tetratricopeptide (TPR) repeat protein